MSADGAAGWLAVAVDFLRLLASAIISAGLAIFVVNKSKSRIDFIEKRIDDICADIRALSDIGTDYWTKDQGQAELGPVEAKIQSRRLQIEELRAFVARDAPEISGEDVVLASAAYLRDLTGGDFGVHNRVVSLERARAVQYSGARYVNAIRKARLAMHTGHR